MSTYARIQSLYETHLRDKGVKLPKDTSAHGQALCCLFENLDTPVSIETLRKYVADQEIGLTGADSLQVRHLARQKGFNMLKQGELHPVTGSKVPKECYQLINLTDCHPSFVPAHRNVTLTDDAWTDLKARYDNQCVNCGSTEGEPMRWDRYTPTVLQKGHMDPRKPLALGNVIPQCKYCNQQYKNKAVFNERGCVIDFCKDGVTAEASDD